MNHRGLPADFAGTVRLFPLPNLVLFPHVGQPLHIFEPRYRELMEDALEDDRLIATALLQAGWEEDYHKKPPIHSVVCIGSILNEERLSDGRFNLILQGVARARILEEVKVNKLYRVARVEILDEQAPASHAAGPLLARLAEQVTPYFRLHPIALEQMQRLLVGGLPLGTLTDIFSFALPLPLEARQELLAQPNVVLRVERLLEVLSEQPPPPPPPPSTGRRF
ncbi:MAG: LON peptidase substrate-binding domain-containing protein, partial [Gemmataceae bacterium]